MEKRKQEEVEHYEKRAKKRLLGAKQAGNNTGGDFEGFSAELLSSFRFCRRLLKERCFDKEVLDYGCGNGIHSVFLAKSGAKVTGIDLSKSFLQIAEKKAKMAGVGENARFLVMDCEHLEFPDNSFDIIFDGGTFSSLDIKKALPELARALQPKGVLIGIETFGHNPFANFNRELNKLTGKRTKWAMSHIFNSEALKEAEKYFGRVDVYYFHLVSWLAFPLLNFPAGKFLLKLLEKLERGLLKAPFLRKYAFKVVFVFSLPRK